MVLYKNYYYYLHQFVDITLSQAIVNQMNLGTVSKVTKHILPRYHLELIQTELN